MLGATVMSQGNRDVVTLVKFDIFVNFVKFVFSPKGRNIIASSRLLKAVAPNEEVLSEFSTSVWHIDQGYRPLCPATAKLAYLARRAGKMLQCIKPATSSPCPR